MSLLKKEYIEHKAAFLYVPGILILLLLLAFSTAVWRNGANLHLMNGASEMGLPLGGIDIFNVLYAMSILGWTAYLTLMLFFFFASSFSSDRKNNALLFWKSLPVSDLNIMGAKTLAGLTVFPIVILIWSFVGAVVGFVAISLASLVSPVIGQLNSGINIWTTLNLEVSAVIFMVVTLLWYTPLFAFVGFLGTLVRSWAVPSFILILVMLSGLEAIVVFGDDGPISRLLDQRFNAPFKSLESVMPGVGNGMPESIHSIVSVGNFVPAYLAQLDWLGMVLGWLVAGLFIYLASEYRRRRLAA
ncbi:MAG TPA: hypothetical protein ENJ90_09615 [Devosia sp.]|nr:hypothetical protein [Devosia sp.]